jgi:Ser/Thr protein kinase RdoA (MazF antagonist)
VRKAPPFFEADLYVAAAEALNARGVRQARPVLTREGGVVSSSGHCVVEWLPGSARHHPTAEQSIAVMEMLARYDLALADVPVPDELSRLDTVWADVVRPSYLLRELRPLMERFAGSDLSLAPVDRGLQVLSDASELLEGLPRQVVHGDVAPDNVLFDGRQLVAIIDFTPHAQPPLFGLAGALYWFYLYSGTVETPVIRHALDVYVGSRAELRPDLPSWIPDERAALVPVLIREALRRLATPLAVSARSGAPPSPSALRHRHRALVRTLLVADGVAR